MTIQLSTPVRNARLDVVETVVGASAKLQIRTGSPPANCAAVDTGTLLCEISLPANFWADASGGTKVLSGAWQGTASGAGTAGHFRLKDNAGTATGMQGTVGMGSGDLSLDNTNIASGQIVNITAFTLTDGNA